MAIRMTKARSKALDIAISLDDLLYEKFKRLNQQLHEDIQRYYCNPKKVLQVMQKDSDGNFLVLKIIDVQVTEDGTEIIVGRSDDR